MSNLLERMLDRRTAPIWLGATVVATAAGITLSATASPLPGTETLSVEDVVDAVAMMALGGLGVALVRREVAGGLGRALVLTAALIGTVWLCGGLADFLAAGGTPSLVAQLLNLAASVLYIPAFVLLLEAPLLLFPTGCLPSSRWRWVVAAAVAGMAASVVSLLLAPGYLDEDVHAWGSNPLGVDALDGPLSVLQTAGLILLLGSVLASAGAVVVRLVSYRGFRRRQMWWFLAGAAPMVVGLFADAGSSAVAEVGSAVVIFAGLLGGMGWALLGSPSRTGQVVGGGQVTKVSGTARSSVR